MTPEEKLSNFHNIVIEQATTATDIMLKEYQAGLDKNLLELENNLRHKSKMLIKNTKENLEREKNKAVSLASTKAKKAESDITKEILDSIFLKVSEKLKYFMTTREYDTYLIKTLTMAISFAKGNPTKIYINPSDSHKKSVLEETMNHQILISDRDFIGGIRAVIPSKNILIDESFLTKLTEQRETYKL